MNKMFAVLKREYIQAVRKKAFIIMTLLFPFLMGGSMMLPTLMMAKGMGEKKIAVLDGTGQLRETFTRPTDTPEKKNAAEEAQKAMSGRRRGPDMPAQLAIEYVNEAGKDVEASAQPYLKRLSRGNDDAQKLDGVFLVPGTVVSDQDVEMTYYSRSATDLMTQERLGRRANKAIQRMRLTSNGISPDTVESLMRDLPVTPVQLSRSGEKKTGGEMNFLIAFLFGAMLMMPSFIYGNETMRGIVQEKSDRVVEVLVSSVTPLQLLTGKVLGVAAVGLTQIAVWVIMGSLAAAYGAAVAMTAGANVAQFFRPMVFVYFVLFFILAYLSYVCIYAIAGAICNTEKEAQQFMAPLLLLMMIPWILMMPIIMNPDSKMAVGLSLSPVFGPITMFVRTLVTEPPLWHVLVSVAASILTIMVFFWATAKIFRVGILSYGKRPTIPELWRWMKVA